MASLHDLRFIALPQFKIPAIRLCIKQCAIWCIPDSGRCILALLVHPSRAVAYNIAKVQGNKIYVALLPVKNFFGMEVWNGNMEENFSMEWKMEWKIFGMEWKKIASMEYGKIVFHSISYHALLGGRWLLVRAPGLPSCH